MTGIARPGPPPARRGGSAPIAVYAVGAAASAFLALAWLALSWWHPALTYHFGPPLAAAFRWVKRHYTAITITSACALAFFGVLLTLNRLTWVTSQLLAVTATAAHPRTSDR